tara:strand:- start:1586 stop:2602 length:1017 start_codon:yes stop_codon:yes gene_type:complete
MDEFYKNLIISLLTFSIGCLVSLISPKILKKGLRKITSATQSKTDDYIASILVDTIKPLGFILSFIVGWKVLLIGGIVDKLLMGISKFIFLIYIVRFINRVFLKIIQRWASKINDASISEMIRSLSPMVRASVWSIGIIFYLQNMGVQMAAIWALLSAGGIGAGLALKEPVQEFFEYITILLDKPFQSGQFIHIDGIWAKVERVGVRSTRLRSINGEAIIMSNSRLTNGVISNYAEMKQRRLVHKLGVVYETSYEQTKRIPEIIKNIVDKTENAIFDRCHFTEFANSSLNFELVYYIPTSNYILAMSAQQEINLKIMQKFHNENINFAYPTQTIYVNN